MTCSKTIPPLFIRAKLSLFSKIALEGIKYCNMEVEWGQWGRRRRRRRAGLATIKDLSRLINPAQQCSQLLLVSMIICGLRFFTMAANNVTKLYTVIFFIPKHTDSSYGWQQCVGQLDFEFQIEFNFNFKSNTIRVFWLAAAVIKNRFLVLHYLFFILNFFL